MMNNPNELMKKLKHYDFSHTSDKDVKEVSELMKNPELTVESLSKKSKAVASMGQFLHALVEIWEELDDRRGEF